MLMYSFLLLGLIFFDFVCSFTCILVLMVLVYNIIKKIIVGFMVLQLHTDVDLHYAPIMGRM